MALVKGPVQTEDFCVVTLQTAPHFDIQVSYGLNGVSNLQRGKETTSFNPCFNLNLLDPSKSCEGRLGSCDEQAMVKEAVCLHSTAFHN